MQLCIFLTHLRIYLALLFGDSFPFIFVQVFLSQHIGMLPSYLSIVSDGFMIFICWKHTVVGHLGLVTIIYACSSRGWKTIYYSQDSAEGQCQEKQRVDIKNESQKILQMHRSKWRPAAMRLFQYNPNKLFQVTHPPHLFRVPPAFTRSSSFLVVSKVGI